MCSGGTSGSRPKSWKNQQKASVPIQFTRPGRRGWWNAGRAGRTGIRCQALCFPCSASIQVPPVKCWEHTFLQGRLQWWRLWSPVSCNITFLSFTLLEQTIHFMVIGYTYGLSNLTLNSKFATWSIWLQCFLIFLQCVFSMLKFSPEDLGYNLLFSKYWV